MTKIIEKLNVHSEFFNANNKYMKIRSSHLTDDEKTVSLLIDEIYLDSKFDFVGGKIIGSSLNDKLSAKTANVYLIRSVFCNYKDVVGIVPANNLTGEANFSHTLKILEGLKDLGFKVLAIITDNNNINKRMFEYFEKTSDSVPSYINPKDSSFPLFLLYDPVHLVKSIRNNWINHKDLIFDYPNFENVNVIEKANFGHLRFLYDLEKNYLIKYSHKLSYKSLYPQSVERQKVSLALKIFCQENAVTLNELGPKHPELNGYKETSSFILIIEKWWNICNVKTPNKGFHKRDQNSTPITDINQEQLIFLLKMQKWLEQWSIVSYGKKYNGLTTRTFQALQQTCLGLYHITVFLLMQVKCKYVLLGKFQTDPLERRFGIYRQLSISNYHLSLRQLFEGEKKLRVSNLIKLAGEKQIQLNSLFDDQCLQSTKLPILNDFNSLKLMTINFDFEDKNFPILLYITGYAVFKISTKSTCMNCKDIIVFQNQNLSYEFSNKVAFIEKLSRGGLKKPTFIATQISFISLKLFENLISENYEHIFLNCQNHLYILTELANHHIKRLNLDQHNCCVNHSPEII